METMRCRCKCECCPWGMKIDDRIGQFIRERLEPMPGGKIKTKDVHAAYEDWCLLSGDLPMNLMKLIVELRKRRMVKRDGTLGNIVYGYRIALHTTLQSYL